LALCPSFYRTLVEKPAARVEILLIAFWQGQSVAEMVEDLLTDQLTFAVAICRQDDVDVVASLERRGDSLELRRLVSADSRARRKEPIRLEDDAGPALPCAIDHL
jgi:hypothetical protein